MTTVGQIHAQDRVSGLKQGKIGGHIGLGPRMGLHIDILGTKEGFGALHGQLFGHINHFAAAVITFVRIALGVLVGQQAPLGRHDRAAGNVLGRDQFQLIALPVQFLFQNASDLRIHGGDIICIQNHLPISMRNLRYTISSVGRTYPGAAGAVRPQKGFPARYLQSPVPEHRRSPDRP